MKLIVGLGNFDPEYSPTRHNAGFGAVEHIAKKFSFPAFALEKNFFGKMSRGQIGDEKIILLKPETWMNLSGKSVATVSNFYKIPPENVIVLFDDADIEFGNIRVREKGSSGGHNGIKSIIACLGTEIFPRIKIGIANEKRKIIPAEDFVLQKFSAEERKKLPEMFEQVSIKLCEKILFPSPRT